MINEIKEKIRSEKAIISGIILLFICIVATWYVYGTGNIRDNGTTNERLDNELKSIENKQSAITDTSERIEKRLKDSATTTKRITGKLEEARDTNTRIVERYNSFEEIINSNAKSIENCERIITESKKRRTNKTE